MTDEDRGPGRPPNLIKNTNRNIRLTDEEWQLFCDYFGPAWLRDRIAEKKAELKATTNY